VLRKDRVLETLRSLYAQRPAQSSVLRRYTGFSAEEIAEHARIDRTNASRDLNILVQEGIVERIPGRPVLFVIKASPTGTIQKNQNGGNGRWHNGLSGLPVERQEVPLQVKNGKPAAIAASVQVGAVVTGFDTLIGSSKSRMASPLLLLLLYRLARLSPASIR